MISFAVADEIKRLLAEGDLSQRKIAGQLGVSRGTVNAIARGKRPDYPPRRPGQGDEFGAPGGPPARCPTCGGMVQMPCLACRVRALKQRRGRGVGEVLPDRPGVIALGWPDRAPGPSAGTGGDRRAAVG